VKTLKLMILLFCLTMLVGCSGLVRVENPTDLDFIAEHSAMAKPIYIDYKNIHEDGIAEDLSDYLNEILPQEGYTLVDDDDDAAVSVDVWVHYFGLNEQAANRYVTEELELTADKNELAATGAQVALETAVRTDAGAQMLASTAGTSVLAVPGVGVLAGSAIRGVGWLMEHGEKDYYMGTTFEVVELPRSKEEKGKRYYFQSSGGGHFMGRGEAIDGLILDAKEDLVGFLLQGQDVVGSLPEPRAEVSTTN